MTETKVDIYQYAIASIAKGVQAKVDEYNANSVIRTTQERTLEGNCVICASNGVEGEATEENVKVYHQTFFPADNIAENYWSHSFVQHQLSQHFTLARDEFGTTTLKTSEGDDATIEQVDTAVSTIVQTSSSRLMYNNTSKTMLDTCLMHTFSCQVCEKLYALLETDYAYEERVCWDCSQSHSWCEWGSHWTTDGCDDVGGEWGCGNCLRDNDWNHCNDCDYWFRDYDGCDCGEYYGTSGNQDWAGVHSYNFKPDPIFHFDAEIDGDLSWSRSRVGKVFMGLEIEVEANGASIQDGVSIIRNELDNNENYIYLKSDGSIECGFEMVTHPATLAGHKKQNLDALKSLAKIGFRGWKTRTCGIHVHVNRDAFNGVPHQWRWTRMFPTNEREFTILAGRTSERWASFEMMKQKLSYSFKHQRGRGDSRYEAINLCNWNTFEVRIFKTTLNTERILMIVELIDSTVEYTRHLTVRDIADHALEWSYYTAWVRSEQAEKYPNLIAYLDKYSI